MTVRIEPLGPEHADAVQRLASDPEIGRTSNVPSPYPGDGAATFITEAVGRRDRGTQFSFAIVAADAVVGVCSLVDVNQTAGLAQLGYWVGRPYWGRGYATSGASQVLEFGFKVLGLRSVQAGCLPGNGVSARVLEKLGFTFAHLGTPRPGSKWPSSQVVEYWKLDRSAAAS
jgi:[ribosomal protein S5]-alanine N-acetyltransferase